MVSNLREVHTIGIHLRHRERFACRQFGYTQWLGFHVVEFTMSLHQGNEGQRAIPDAEEFSSLVSTNA
jgi:hypothetical protein